MNDDKLISTLVELIESCEDGGQGFRTCFEDEGNQSRNILFMDLALRFAASKRELQGLVRGLGGQSKISGMVESATHRRWIDVKSAILSKDLESILEECERGEDAALHNYRDALNKDLPIQIRHVGERQYQGALCNREMVKRLRDQAGTVS